MKIMDLRNDDAKEWKRLLSRHYSPGQKLVDQVATILSEIRISGDAALIGFAERFDRVKFKAGELRVSDQELDSAFKAAEKQLLAALNAASLNVREFALRSKRIDWTFANAQGALVGEHFFPIDRVGIYVPAGTAPLVSTAIMTVSLAAAIGVPEIVVVSPVGPTKEMNSGLLAAMRLAGATEVFKVGGAQAIGALAFGTESIRRVSKIFGPGNAYVTEAKRQVFGFAGIDLLPGPSEILVLADRTANAEWVAADLLAQAEHGHGSVICLISLDEELITNVRRAIDEQMDTLRRKNFLREVLEQNAFFILAKHQAQAIEIVNDFAPEHLSLAVQEPETVAKSIRTAGAIFIGNYSPVAAGDFLAGPSHELPTGGAGKSFAGLTADQFQRRTSVVQYDSESLRKSVPIISQFSRVEHLDAHGRSATIRFE